MSTKHYTLCEIIRFRRHPLASVAITQNDLWDHDEAIPIELACNLLMSAVIDHADDVALDATSDACMAVHANGREFHIVDATEIDR